MENTKTFILANTQPASLFALEQEHIVPVFAKDNERAISHAEFVHAIYDAVKHVYRGEQIRPAEIRVSHPIHGRVPEALHKKPAELMDHEKTLYYERMMFNIQLPSHTVLVDGHQLSLSIGGVKSYSQDRLSGKLTPQKFKVYVGYQVSVCSNLCVSADGCVAVLEASHADELFLKAIDFLEGYSEQELLDSLKEYASVSWSREEFEAFVGNMRVLLYDPKQDTKGMFGDTQLGHMTRGYFENEHFGAEKGGRISLWSVYNLLTEANKSSYVDSYLERMQYIPKMLEPWIVKH